ncbi:type I polyketide synthase [Micromonospora sp. DT229]|uniref:type I polyketide synthase n=1 Tax=Micromonospora sp. DT229 TaxID=3393430 RepID=UPI003CF0C8C6
MNTHGRRDSAEPEPVAIVGMGCRLPGGIESPRELWDLLRSNGDAVGEVPPDRWKAYAARGADYALAVRRAIRSGGYLDDIAGFDADFFGISPREAELMDPQQRITMEVAWEALEHAGIAPSSLAGSDTSVFMGVCCDDYGRRLLEDLPRLEAWTGIGSSMCAVANRVSHALDLRGPSVTVDTACSASLVAIHQACQSLRAGDTSLALAGGVMLVASPSFALVLEAAGALSPDGTSKAFDAAANGYVRSEGCAILALRRLSDAQRDGDTIMAVIRGSAVCQDGRTNGIMAPSMEAQVHLMRQAARNADVALRSIDYIEAHGTGTGVGDPIEASALTATVGLDRAADQPCLIGSVKSNVGHLEAASGVVGVIKVVLSMQHELIPATLSQQGPNPQIPWESSGLRVVAQNTPWPSVGQVRRAGVGNYGYGGTLAHVILEEAPPRTAGRNGDNRMRSAGAMLFPLSARTEAGLRANAGRLARWLTEDENTALNAIGHTLAYGRSALPVRAGVVAADRAELVTRLEQLAAGRSTADVVTGRVHPGAATPAAVWVFSGHGAQWQGMGRNLLETEPEVARTLDELDPIFREELGIAPRQVLLDGHLEEVGEVQAMTFAMQVALARVWRGYGLQPAAIIGHSVGEVAAAVAAGLLDLPGAARLICRRSRLLRQVAGKGAMVMVDLPFDVAQAWLTDTPGATAAIAASPSSTVISGDAATVEQIATRWATEGIKARRVNSDVAFHSPHMDPLVPDLLAACKEIVSHQGKTTVYTTAMDDPRADPPRDAAYWAANLRNPVQFSAAVAAAIEDGHRLFLEVSTHPVVAHSILQNLAAHAIEDGAVFATLVRDRPEHRTLLTNLGKLHCFGVPVDFAVLHRGGDRADLPTMAWQHRRYWVEPTPTDSRAFPQHDVESHTVLGPRTVVQGASSVSLWQSSLDEASRPYPGGHKVLGAEILPAAVVLTTFLAAAGSGRLADVTLRVPVAVTMPRDVQVVRQDNAVRLSSRLVGQRASEDAWATHATATAMEPPSGAFGRLSPLADAEVLDPDCVMDLLRTIGVVGIGFPWLVREVCRTDDRIVARVSADPDRLMATNTWASLFDAGLSAAPVLFAGTPRLRMPGRMRDIVVTGDPPQEALISVSLLDAAWSDGLLGDVLVEVQIANLDGTVLARLDGVHFGVVQQAAPQHDAEEDLAAGPEPTWRDVPEADLAGLVETAVREVVATELRLDPNEIDGHRPLSEMGADSLLTEAIRHAIGRALGMSLPEALLWDHPSVAAMAGYLTDQLTSERLTGGTR